MLKVPHIYVLSNYHFIKWDRIEKLVGLWIEKKILKVPHIYVLSNYRFIKWDRLEALNGRFIQLYTKLINVVETNELKELNSTDIMLFLESNGEAIFFRCQVTKRYYHQSIIGK